MAIALWVVIFVAVLIIMMGLSSSQGKAGGCGVLVIWLILQLVGVMIIFGSLAGLAGVEFGPGGAEEASRALTSKVLTLDVIYALVGALLCYGIKRSKLPPRAGARMRNTPSSLNLSQTTWRRLRDVSGQEEETDASQAT